MAKDGRIYYLRHMSGSAKLVRADTRAQAINHAAKSEFTCEVASQNTLVELLGAGMEVEDARQPQMELIGDSDERSAA